MTPWKELFEKAAGTFTLAAGDGRTAPLFTINVTFQVNVGSGSPTLTMESVGDDKPETPPKSVV